jgi:glutamate-1-semialdehyde 2,1-aminomutase
VLESENVLQRIFKLGLQLMEGLRQIGKQHNTNLLVQGLGPMLHAGFTDLSAVHDFRDVLSYDKVKLNKFIAAMHDQGIRIIGRGLWYISAAHSEEDINTALDKTSYVLKRL